MAELLFFLMIAGLAFLFEVGRAAPVQYERRTQDGERSESFYGGVAFIQTCS